MTTPTRSACAWCGKELRPGPEPTSHGVCEACAQTIKVLRIADDPELSREHERRLRAKVALALAEQADAAEEDAFGFGRKPESTVDKVLILVGLAVCIPMLVMMLVLAWKLWGAK